MNRKQTLNTLRTQVAWDIIVIGGGATGLGVALDAVTRGYKTLLLEAHDFAKGTSSRSTKLLHGGVRYLAQGNLELVSEALRERGRLAHNAPHLFHAQPFIIPCKNWLGASYYRVGLGMYDKLSGKLGIGATNMLSRDEARARLPAVKHEQLNLGICYYDGQFDDARLALTLAQSVHDHGGTVLNYCAVTGLEKNEAGKICGVRCRDELDGGEEMVLQAACVVNAAGAFADTVLAWDDAGKPPRILLSQGTHLVLDAEFMPGTDALMVPKTSDGRVLFAIPWHGKLLVGTTDTPVPAAEYEPKPLAQETEFILNTLKDYLQRTPTAADVKSVFVGLRPLVKPADSSQSSKEVSRSHVVEVSPSGLLSIFGGKWTTYRQMAQDGVDKAIQAGLLPERACQTENLRLHGAEGASEGFGKSHLSVYGGDAVRIRALAEQDETLSLRIHPDHPYTYAQVAWALEHEAAHTLEDVLARRIRLLFLDAAAAAACAAEVADFIAVRLGWGAERTAREIESFNALSRQYLLSTVQAA
ncbi:MAG: glycerol-3-phosphate dehydrogenase/oxidase [Conchiformibius sp.]|nr:glycerol-3-phosphate dehydrogenase/oxidase [Conchiformibius sp.]